MRNYVQPGEVVGVIAPYDVLSGDPVQVGSVFGIAVTDALTGTLVQVNTTGIYDLTKVSAQAWAPGQTLYWDNTAKKLTTVATGNTQVGAVLETAANPTASGRLRLNGNTLSDPAGVASSVSGAAAAAAANVCEVTINVVDAAGNAAAATHHLDVWLSDATTGAGLTSTSASGTVTAKAASGVVLQIYSAKKAIRAQTLATGVFILEITDTAKTAFKVFAAVGGKAVLIDTLAAGDYG